jgi:hypothetical protein
MKHPHHGIHSLQNEAGTGTEPLVRRVYGELVSVVGESFLEEIEARPLRTRPTAPVTPTAAPLSGFTAVSGRTLRGLRTSGTLRAAPIVPASAAAVNGRISSWVIPNEPIAPRLSSLCRRDASAAPAAPPMPGPKGHMLR